MRRYSARNKTNIEHDNDFVSLYTAQTVILGAHATFHSYQ